MLEVQKDDKDQVFAGLVLDGRLDQASKLRRMRSLNLKG